MLHYWELNQAVDDYFSFAKLVSPLILILCFCSLFSICSVFYVLTLMQSQTLCQSKPPLTMSRLIRYSASFIFLRKSLLEHFDLPFELVTSAPGTQLSSGNCSSLLFWGVASALLCWVFCFLHLMSPSFYFFLLFIYLVIYLAVLGLS